MMSSIVSRGLQSLLIVGLALTVLRAQSSGQGSVTTGEVPGINCGVVTACTSGLRVNFNPQVCGTVTAPDGSRWAVPSAVHDGPAAVDVYNDCTGPGDVPDYLSKVPTVVIDPDGVEITGYIFADNYYELYVNGTFIAKDSLGMTPFNSTVVRFRAKYPITYAIKAVDWETHLGVGMEYDRYNVGDGGVIAHFSDGTITGPHWKVETFYIAPLGDPSCVTTTNGRDSTACPSQGHSVGSRVPCAELDPGTCKALHFPVPEDWTTPGFDDSAWPAATTYRSEDVTRAPGYARHTALFGSAQFIWTRNLRLDNLVLGRYTGRGPAQMRPCPGVRGTHIRPSVKILHATQESL